MISYAAWEEIIIIRKKFDEGILLARFYNVFALLMV